MTYVSRHEQAGKIENSAFLLLLKRLKRSPLCLGHARHVNSASRQPTPAELIKVKMERRSESERNSRTWNFRRVQHDSEAFVAALPGSGTAVKALIETYRVAVSHVRRFLKLEHDRLIIVTSVYFVAVTIETSAPVGFSGRNCAENFGFNNIIGCTLGTVHYDSSEEPLAN